MSACCRARPTARRWTLPVIVRRILTRQHGRQHGQFRRRRDPWRGVGEVNASGPIQPYLDPIPASTTAAAATTISSTASRVSLDQVNYFGPPGGGRFGGRIQIYYHHLPTAKAATEYRPSAASALRARAWFKSINGNLWYVDTGVSPIGIYAVAGTPNTSEGSLRVLSETNSPVDFAVSPDARTVYVADNGTFTGSANPVGGIQRFDTNTVTGGYSFSYTLATGAEHHCWCARGITVDFSATGTWGSGVAGDKDIRDDCRNPRGTAPHQHRGYRIVVERDDAGRSRAPTAPSRVSGSGPVANPVSITGVRNQAIYATATAQGFSVTASGQPP